MNFIGRASELHTLEGEFNRGSGFVVIYGRRRVGKTTLIREFIKNRPALYFLADEEMEKGNIKRFSRILADFTGQEFIRNAHFSAWDDLFRLFAAHRPEMKKILVIDEFQYLVSVNPAFASIFQGIWDEHLRDRNIMVILCGSLLHMMTSQLLSYSSPLYGRRTAQIRLAPLKFTEILRNRPGESFERLVETYSVTGGVPKYMEFFDNDQPVIDTIAKEVLRKNSFLYEEPVFLLEREVKELVSYFSILKTIAAGNHKLSQMAGILEVPSHALSPYLKTLMELDLVRKRLPVTETHPDRSRKGLYFISDFFIEFWFRFVYEYKGELELDNIGFVLRKIEESFIDRHVSFVYEEICRDMLSLFCREGAIDFVPSRIGSYWDSRCEIDIMAVDEREKRIIAGECKYRVKPVDADVYFDLRKKVEATAILEGYQRVYALFSKSGFTDRARSLAGKGADLVLIDREKVVGK